MTIRDHIALAHTLNHAKIARRFLLLATQRLPQDARAITKDVLVDARDALETALGAIEEESNRG